MAKIDEIMEVLTQEIAGFNASIGKLEELSKTLSNQKVQADTSVMEYHINDFLRTQKRTMESVEKQMTEVVVNLKTAQLTPKWEGTILLVFLCINTIAFSYLGYYFIQFEDKNRVAFNKGRDEGVGIVRGYFNDHPIIYKDFEKWTQKRDSIPNQK
ncbi:DUF6730 family protein [Maribacter sp. MAR_2009_72]|uniref:DUF6730 family protein n=1 Tax=Maribacter sp. MAR_2009_72 TaxID=1250050 RepID=UPI00119990C6|nr:DUF6730 family protein [Maribacter sp. MAR_2009_72]TVZ14883.1 hypothetical protein JM81_1096 [Maribacter sp. MAR_2009_72]